MPKTSKTTSWSEIRTTRSKLSPDTLGQIAIEAAEDGKRYIATMKLDQLRKARALSQTQLAEQLHTNQGAVSRIEKQTDLYVGTLRRFVHGMGGRLTITAEFPDAEPIELDLFSDLEDRAFTRERR